MENQCDMMVKFGVRILGINRTNIFIQESPYSNKDPENLSKFLM